MRDEIILSPNTPHKSAETFREMRRPNLICLEGEWLDYSKSGAYVAVTDATIKAEVQRFLIEARRRVAEETDSGGVDEKTAPFNPKRAHTGEVRDALSLVCHRAIADSAPPCWLDGRKGPDPARIIVCKNGLLDIDTSQLLPHTSKFFTRCALPVMYDELAPLPTRFLTFLSEITDERQPLIDLIQEMLGYLLSGDTEQEVVFYLLGKSRGGKGTLQKIILALLGQLNVAAPTIRSFSVRCWAYALMSKSVAIITDMAITDKDATKLAANHINMVSGRDPIDVERLYLPALTSVTLPTRIVMAGNSLPDFGDHAGALANRLLVIPFDVSFKDREDRSLARMMIANELPAILSWAIDGLRRLQARGHFVEPPESVAVKNELVRLANPVRVFVDDRCIVRSDLHVSRDVLYANFQSWAKTVGQYPIARKDFMQRLNDVVPCRRFRPRGEDGEQVPHIVGLALKEMGREFDFATAMRERLALGATEAEAFADTETEAMQRTVGDFTTH